MPKDPQYAVALDDGKLQLEPVAGDASVVITASEADAEALRQGDLDLAVAFMQGRVKAAGDMKTFLELLTRSRSLR